MTDGDLGVTLFFGISGVIGLFMGHTVISIIFIVIAAIMVGMAMGKNPNNFD
jgi:hypothetical protein